MKQGTTVKPDSLLLAAATCGDAMGGVGGGSTCEVTCFYKSGAFNFTLILNEIALLASYHSHMNIS